MTRSTVPISIPSSSDAVAIRTLICPSFSFFSAASRSLRDKLPWCAANIVFPDPLRQMMRDPLDQPPRVHKHQRRAVLLGKLDDAGVDFLPHFVTRNRP